MYVYMYTYMYIIDNIYRSVTDVYTHMLLCPSGNQTWLTGTLPADNCPMKNDIGNLPLTTLDYWRPNPKTNNPVMSQWMSLSFIYVCVQR